MNTPVAAEHLVFDAAIVTYDKRSTPQAVATYGPRPAGAENLMVEVNYGDGPETVCYSPKANDDSTVATFFVKAA